jgi:hypothetical protein
MLGIVCFGRVHVLLGPMLLASRMILVASGTVPLVICVHHRPSFWGP